MSAVHLPVRAPRAAELRGLADIEDSGIGLFVEWFGEDGIGAALRSPAPSGQERLAASGLLLVIGTPVIGFVHVLHIDGYAHLEQISVLPGEMRRGVGTSLVRAAMRESRVGGFDRLSLCTYRDVPWNGPFYAGLGFRVLDDLLPFQRRLREHEASLGLDETGVRVVMSVDLTGQDPRAGPQVTGE